MASDFDSSPFEEDPDTAERIQQVKIKCLDPFSFKAGDSCG